MIDLTLAPQRGTSGDALQRDLTTIRHRLEASGGDGETPRASDPLMVESPALMHASAAFGLSPFERDLLLLCAATELDSETAASCEAIHRQTGQTWVSFALASRVLAEPHWSALLPTSPLRYWQLLDVETAGNEPLTHARLRITERLLHHLTGLVYLDSALHPWVAPCQRTHSLWPSEHTVASRLAQHIDARADAAVVLTGGDRRARRDVTAHAAGEAGMRVFVMAAEDVPAEPATRDRLARLWMRESLLSRAVLLLEGASSAVTALAERIGTALVISADEGLSDSVRPLVRVEMARPTVWERRDEWVTALGESTHVPADRVRALAATFAISPGQIAATVDAAGDSSTSEGLWTAARLQARPALGDLAERIEPAARWDDLVLPTAQMALMRQIAVHVRQRPTVYEEWGFGVGNRGLGLSVLFAGASGTGKTLASEVLATELALDLYRIDLSQVVSKYIGETEKNLRRVFDGAEGSGAILLFDEADALFGKRSEVRDSHDRYANIEVAYLLQRMEEYRGLAILATNMRTNLDPAFLRRLRFVLEFPFPDVASREALWRRAFPPATPLAVLDLTKLARLTLTGGNIRNIAMNAAFLAAEAQRPISAANILQAARIECAKIERPLTEAETRDWL